MEVNGWPICKSGGGGAKHAQGFKKLNFYIHEGHLPDKWFIFSG